ncbi:HAMP domain-containing sensor histidine kinase [Corynebacterium aquilae]|uniref:HAMP domain-containing sensor histidine kinase n=1 Tax=Corynebacterium aquilae TaxID=203263 RepID=UPI001FE6080C|nr:HAMP domain-containing sensor histidine kinase [Corynebacterium aquilae]
MILRKTVGRQAPQGVNRSSRRTSLRWQLSVVTASMVALAVLVMSIVAYWTVSASLSHQVDEDLDAKANSLLSKSFDPNFLINPGAEVAMFKVYNPDIRIAYFGAGSMAGVGDPIDFQDEAAVLQNEKDRTVRTAGNERILAKRNAAGARVILAQDMGPTHQMISSLGIVLLLIGGLGVLVAIAAGAVAATAGLRPVKRLQNAVDYVARTDDLRPIAVEGTDEVAQLTNSFNGMLSALQASRNRQTELVADAGHELKTPLTSLRTNIELLMMVSQAGGAQIAEQDRRDLERDVIAQLDELSTLVGDLVDLAREDGPEKDFECVDLVETVETSLERVQRRRSDVTFDVRTTPWFIEGDSFALSRAVLNLLDNAAKWSPEDGVVRVVMQERGGQLALTISDSGPGIPVNEREKVFERFYRSIQSRSMPGSGLGLAIVKQVINRHNGTIVASESDDGGTMMTVTLPGGPDVESHRTKNEASRAKRSNGWGFHI